MLYKVLNRGWGYALVSAGWPKSEGVCADLADTSRLGEVKLEDWDLVPCALLAEQTTTVAAVCVCVCVCVCMWECVLWVRCLFCVEFKNKQHLYTCLLIFIKLWQSLSKLLVEKAWRAWTQWKDGKRIGDHLQACNRRSERANGHLSDPTQQEMEWDKGAHWALYYSHSFISDIPESLKEGGCTGVTLGTSPYCLLMIWS